MARENGFTPFFVFHGAPCKVDEDEGEPDYGGTSEAESAAFSMAKASDSDASDWYSVASGTVRLAPAASRGEEEQEGMFRRDGVPCSAVVDRKGDIWVMSSQQESTEHLRHLLELRLAKLRDWGLEEDAFLPLEAQREVQSSLQEQWLREPNTRQITWHLAGKSQDQQKRTLASYWKTTQFHRYGGMVWARILIAVGDISPRIIEIANEIIAEKIREAGRDPSDTPAPNPRLSARALAAAQGKAVPARTGIQHRRSEAEVAREEAQRLQRE